MLEERARATEAEMRGLVERADHGTHVAPNAGGFQGCAHPWLLSALDPR